MSLDIRIWQDGRFQDDQETGPAGPQDTDWQRVEGNDEKGVEVRYQDGQKLYRAYAVLSGSEEYTGQREAVSASFQAYDEADAKQVSAYDTINPIREQQEENTRATIARLSLDTATQAALSDMRRLANELAADLDLPYRQWYQRNERHITLFRASEPLRNTIEAMFMDIQEHGQQEAYTLFAKQLQTILKGHK